MISIGLPKGREFFDGEERFASLEGLQYFFVGGDLREESSTPTLPLLPNMRPAAFFCGLGELLDQAPALSGEA